MFYDLLIVSKLDMNNSILENINYLKVESLAKHELKDYKYDYLITSSYELIKTLDALVDDGIVICNYFLETSIDNVFYIGKENGSNRAHDEQFKLIIEYITEKP